MGVMPKGPWQTPIIYFTCQPYAEDLHSFSSFTYSALIQLDVYRSSWLSALVKDTAAVPQLETKPTSIESCRQRWDPGLGFELATTWFPSALQNLFSCLCPFRFVSQSLYNMKNQMQLNRTNCTSTPLFISSMTKASNHTQIVFLF